MNNNDIVPGFDEEKDDSLKIRLQRVDEVENCLVLYLTGYIDTYNSNFFQKRV
ncbi:MAG TPA: anti-sigma F factor antagonist, partial [Spirochaetia bacterium]|nr:anti-sigma F factor antagonist [Spirochaetia bacterium]